MSGCGAVGRVTEGDAGHGKQLFLHSAKPSEPSCASCHTLADAKSQGTIGPNLDDAFASVKTGTFSEEQTIRDVVRGQIAYPEEPMPANLYRGQDARDIAVYIGKCAGNPTCGVTATNVGGPPATTTTTGGGGGGAAAPDGKTVFASAGCGSCHTLKDAGSNGTVGPNLDQLKPAEATVEHQVEVGGGAMPSFKGQLSAAEIKAVAKYVSSVAGK
jgi:mono/diheme cytochrome c family protein